MRCRGFSSYSACAENGMTSSVPSGFTKSFAGSGLLILRRSGFFVVGASSVATRSGLFGWRCVAGVLMRGAWRAAALEAAQASATTRRGCIAAMARWTFGRACALVDVLAQPEAAQAAC